jgi:hypothetical protein
MVYETTAEVIIRIEAENEEEAEAKIATTSQWDDWELIDHGRYREVHSSPHVGGGPKP